MTISVSGPLFDPQQDEWRRSVFRKSGGHYNIYLTHTPDTAMAMLRAWFPDGEANEFNFVLFSTSGVHGMYTTIEDAATGIGHECGDPDNCEVPHEPEVTFLLVQPRIVGMTYGNARLRSPDDAAFLKKLRESSWRVLTKIGAPSDALECVPPPRDRPEGPPEKRVIWYPADGSPGPSDTKPALASEQPTAGAPEKSDQATPDRSLEEK